LLFNNFIGAKLVVSHYSLEKLQGKVFLGLSLNMDLKKLSQKEVRPTSQSIVSQVVLNPQTAGRIHPTIISEE
jgi:hypothetical protein